MKCPLNETATFNTLKLSIGVVFRHSISSSSKRLCPLVLKLRNFEELVENVFLFAREKNPIGWICLYLKFETNSIYVCNDELVLIRVGR